MFQALKILLENLALLAYFISYTTSDIHFCLFHNYVKYAYHFFENRNHLVMVTNILIFKDLSCNFYISWKRKSLVYSNYFCLNLLQMSREVQCELAMYLLRSKFVNQNMLGLIPLGLVIVVAFNDVSL